jgi:hypothetical protein
MVWCERKYNPDWGMIVPSKLVRRDISGELPSLALCSWEIAWMSQVASVGLATWSATSDILATWLPLARAVNGTNAQIFAGELPPNPCKGTPEMTQIVQHPCNACSVDMPCKSLALDQNNIRVCSRCLAGAHGNRPPILEARVIRILKASVGRDRRAVGFLGSLDNTTYLNALISWARTTLDHRRGKAYTNQYSGKLLGMLSSHSSHQHPLCLSCGAIFPFSLDNTGKAAIHWVDNLALVPWALNSCKYTSLPIDLQVLGTYRRSLVALDEPIKSRDAVVREEVNGLQCALVVDCSRFTTIRRKFPESFQSAQSNFSTSERNGFPGGCTQETQCRLALRLQYE